MLQLREGKGEQKYTNNSINKSAEKQQGITGGKQTWGGGEGNEGMSNGGYSSISQMLVMSELHRNTPNLTHSSFRLKGERKHSKTACSAAITTDW